MRGRDGLPHFDAARDHDAVGRRLDDGVLQIQLCLTELRARLHGVCARGCHGRDGRIVRRLRRFEILGRDQVRLRQVLRARQLVLRVLLLDDRAVFLSLDRASVARA